MPPIGERPPADAFQSHKYVVDTRSQFGVSGHSMGNSFSTQSVQLPDDLPETLDKWSKQIHAYIVDAGDDLDSRDLARRILPATVRSTNPRTFLIGASLQAPVARALVHAHPLLIEEGIELVTNLAMTLGDDLRPFLIKVIKIIMHDTKCSQKLCIQSLARLAVFDITCIAECFGECIYLDGTSTTFLGFLDDVAHDLGRMRQMYYHILRSVVDGPTLVHLGPDAYDILLRLLLDCLCQFREPLRQNVVVVMHRALESEKFPSLWANGWDKATKKRFKDALPESRRIAKLWAMEKYAESPPPRRHWVKASGQPPAAPSPSIGTAKRRPLSSIGRLPNDVDISSIPGDLSHVDAMLFDDDTLPPRPEPPPRRPTPKKRSTPRVATVPPLVFPSSPAKSAWTTAHLTWRWDVNHVLWGVLLVSLVFAFLGATHGMLAFAQDFEAWKQRIALGDYQSSIDRSEREVHRAAWRLKELARGVTQTTAKAPQWTEDHAHARAISAAWDAIHTQLQPPGSTSPAP
ncbi:Aste57867_22984 [Aphanomyces stellatus]|uniref:Aste57867_22984 protein n=1 Tax=Aphanomyces stellatus TaxID=120398 RepID=A0A485LLN3_9STRA|nr:hypothetical protein As57867_022913 [Aphanomyces stellatus]VFT99633.1 Aste57867_22984 [Aphanomyces stellatus]